MGLSVMVTNYGGDPFIFPNGAPLAPRWALGGPHRDLAPSPQDRKFGQIGRPRGRQKWAIG